MPKAETGQDRRALVTDEKTEVQRDKVTCPRSHSWVGGEVGPGVLILLTWSQASEENQGPPQAPAASSLGAEGGWQDSVTLGKSIPLAGSQFPLINGPKSGNLRVYTSALAF